jgi:hypothetical protein
MVEDFVLHIDADAANTFFQLHEILQEECRFDPSQLVTFFSADEEWDKVKEIKMFPGSNSPGFASNGMIMRNTRLDKFLRSEEDKLLYTFDINNDKSLYIELLNVTEDEILKTPVVRLHKGKAPEQSPQGNLERLSGDGIRRDSQQSYDDLGELEDLYGIYGEMTDNVL